jgi:hypothetical protein
MNPVVLQLKTELAQAKKEFKDSKSKIQRLLCEIQILSNPYVSDFELLKADEIAQAACELAAEKENVLELSKKIKQLENALGG